MQSGFYGFPPGRILKSTTFYSSGYFGVPLGVHTVWLTGAAPGGGGGRFFVNSGGAITLSYSGGGGAGEHTFRQPLNVISGILIPVAIGTAGASGASGGNISFGDLLTLSGGEAGGSHSQTTGSTVSGLRLAGGKYHGQPSAAHGKGGDSPWGKGGILTGIAPLAVNTTGVTGTGYAAGGSGCYAESLSSAGTSIEGGAGLPGFITVEWFEDF
jgi:hypothetical protein